MAMIDMVIMVVMFVVVVVVEVVEMLMVVIEVIHVYWFSGDDRAYVGGAGSDDGGFLGVGSDFSGGG